MMRTCSTSRPTSAARPSPLAAINSSGVTRAGETALASAGHADQPGGARRRGTTRFGRTTRRGQDGGHRRVLAGLTVIELWAVTA